MPMRRLLLGLLAIMTASLAWTQSFTYQGFLRQGGNPANGTFNMTFTLFNHPTNTGAGAQVGSPITLNNVAVQNGLFTVEFNFGSVWDGSDRWLEIRVGSTTLSPRVKLNPTPYAAYALRPWQTAGSAVFYNDGNVGIGTNAPAAPLSLGGSLANTKLALWQGATAADVMGLGVAPDQFRLHLHNPANRFSFLNAPDGSELVTILGNGNVGVGLTAPAAKLHIRGGNLRVDGGEIQSWGPITLHPDVDNTGDDIVRVVDSAGTEVMRVHSNGYVGIGTSSPSYPLHVETDAAPIAIFGRHTATTGAASAVQGATSAPSGRGVYGVATATASDAVASGVYGTSFSPGGAGVAGFNSAGNGTNFGVYGESNSPAGRGVYGVARTSSGTNFGVLGLTNSTSGYGVYSLGRLAATDKLFQIDHPLRPETHYLNHFCIEGPEPYTAYSGNVVTDAKGYATVQLPDYFESINRDFRYQLTVIDSSNDFVQAKVVREIQNNQFVIRTSKPRVKVSWEVKAVRNDLWIQRYGYQAEQEKPEGHRGKYLHPELYGQPKERGIFHHPEPAQPHGGEQP